MKYLPTKIVQNRTKLYKRSYKICTIVRDCIVCTILYDLGRQVSQQLMTILKKLALFYRRSVQVGGNDISTEDQGWGQYPLYGKRTMKCTPKMPLV